ncbi:hypothetical protein EZS27_028415, partial [termite gut metagenome]
MNKNKLIVLTLILLFGVLYCPATTIEINIFKKKKKTETTNDSTQVKKNKYDEFFKGEHETVNGMFTIHKMKGKLYFEMPVELFGCEMLIGSTVTEISDNSDAIIGSKPVAPLHVYFTKTDTYVQLRQINARYITMNQNIDQALEKSKIGVILKNAKIEVYNNDSTKVVFEMTDFFVSDNKKMTTFDENSLNGSYERNAIFKNDCSYLT